VSDPSIGQTPKNYCGDSFGSFALYAKLTHGYGVFSPCFPAHTPDPAAVSASRGAKTPNLRLRRNHPGTPRPQPVLAEILRLDKKPVLPLSGPVSRVKRRRGGVNRAVEGVYPPSAPSGV
jgi:hypothetical protein